MLKITEISGQLHINGTGIFAHFLKRRRYLFSPGEGANPHLRPVFLHYVNCMYFVRARLLSSLQVIGNNMCWSTVQALLPSSVDARRAYAHGEGGTGLLPLVKYAPRPFDKTLLCLAADTPVKIDIFFVSFIETP